MWFDSHCHLHLCDDPADDVVARAAEAGVTAMVTLGTDVDTSGRCIELATAHAAVRAAVGVHPNDAHTWDEGARTAIEALVRHPAVVAVGETGIDLYRDRVPLARQADAFEAHIALARDTGKALVIHTRDSIDEALGILAAAGAPERFVFHCWSGPEDRLRRALDLGAYVGFAGNVSFNSAQDLRDAAAVVPADRLLVETDSPYLAPVPRRGKPNEPSYVPFVGAAVAAARGEPTEAVAEATFANACALFAWEPR